MHRQIHKYSYTTNYTRTYPFCVLWIECHVARTQTKFCRSCPHHMKIDQKQEIVTNARKEIGVETDATKMNRLVNIMQKKIPT